MSTKNKATFVLLLNLITFILCNPLFAASLKGTADALGVEATKIGLGLGVFALAVAGTFLALGKQEGGQNVTFAVIGIIVILSAPTIINILRSVTGGGIA